MYNCSDHLSIPETVQISPLSVLDSTYHSEIRDHLCPGDVELEQVGAVGADLVEEHIVRDVPLERQLRQTRTIDCKNRWIIIRDCSYLDQSSETHLSQSLGWNCTSALLV